MNTNQFKILIISFSTLCNVFFGLSQIEKGDERTKFGGISFKAERQLMLEKVNSGVYFKFNYMVENESLLEKRSDTLLLALGMTQSVFLDPTYKVKLESNRKARFARSRKAKLINNEYENIDDVFELINITSDYKEDNPGEPVQIYKKRDTGVVSSIYNSYSLNVRCDQKIDEMFHWQILDEIEEILGYRCQKAKVEYAGRSYTAWFTTEIPINDGPWKFWGLPGLILKVTDNQKQFEWIGIGIENIDADLVIDNGNYEKVDLAQFRDFVNRETSTIMVSFYNNDILYSTNRKRTIQKIPIELIRRN